MPTISCQSLSFWDFLLSSHTLSYGLTAMADACETGQVSLKDVVKTRFKSLAHNDRGSSTFLSFSHEALSLTAFPHVNQW